MSVDISLVLSGRETSGAPALFPHLVSTASPASLQTLLSSLLRKLTGASLGHLLTILTSSPELCRANGETAVPLLTKHLQRPGLPAREHRLSCQCLSLLIENSLATSEAGRTISGSASSLISVILSSQSGQTLASSLQLLIVLMRRYPGSCGQARQKIQERVFSLVETGGKVGRGRGSSVLAKCLSLSCQVGGGGKEGAEHSAQYSALLCSLVSTIHSGLQEIFQGVREVENYVEIIQQGSPVNLKSGNISQRASQLVTLMELLGVILTTGFPQARKVSVESLLSLPVRVMSLEVEAGDSPHSQLLASLHSLLSCSSLALLTSLLTSLGDQLAPSAGHINRLLLTGLARSTQSQVRAELYRALTRWLEVAGLSSGVEYCSASLVTSMVSDLTPVRQKMRLQSASLGNNKQKRKKGDFSERAEETESLDVSLALAAVTALEEVVRVVGGWLQPPSQTEITRCLLAGLLSASPRPRLASGLVSCLQTLLTSPLSISPAQISLPLLTRLLHSPGLSAQARQCLDSLNLMMQPARLTLSTEDTRTAALSSLSELREISSTASQTDRQQPEEPQNTEEKMERINQMESELRKAKQAEASARAELLKRELEISQLKANSVKRSSMVIGETEITGVGVVTKKKKYSNNQEDQPRSPSPVPDLCNLELSNSPREDGDHLTVQDMLKDFSDKLNDNIVPKFTKTESDSE